MPGAARSRASTLLGDGQHGGDDQDQPEQDEPERDRAAVVAGRDLQRATALASVCGLPCDVPADEHDRAHLGERGAERRDPRGEHADARLAERERTTRWQPAGAERARLVEQRVAGTAWTEAAVSATTSGSASTVWASTITP